MRKCKKLANSNVKNLTEISGLNEFDADRYINLAKNYLSKLIKPLGIKVTRIARGLPMGSDLEFADDATIGRAVLNRIEI